LKLEWKHGLDLPMKRAYWFNGLQPIAITIEFANTTVSFNSTGSVEITIAITELSPINRQKYQNKLLATAAQSDASPSNRTMRPHPTSEFALLPVEISSKVLKMGSHSASIRTSLARNSLTVHQEMKWHSRAYGVTNWMWVDKDIIKEEELWGYVLYFVSC